jgi:ribosomal protein L22
VAAPPQTRPEVKASAKWVRTSARKARLVVEHIRGRSVPEARTVLAFTQRAVARDVEKLLQAAVANAEANHGLIGDDLIVSAAYVDEGPVFKRWRARARGRAARIRHKTCHITLRLSPVDEVAVTRAEPAPAEEKPKRAPRRKAAPKAKTETTEKAEKPKPKAQAKRKPPARKSTTTRKKKESES